MHQQTAGIVFVTMPPPEVVRSVAGIQEPFKVYAGNIAHDPGFEQLFDFRIAGTVTIVERHSQVPAGAFHGINDPLTFDSIGGHGFFDVFHSWGAEHFGSLNWLKGAVNYADKIVAVSPKYAEEILTNEYGEGMDYTLNCKI